MSVKNVVKNEEKKKTIVSKDKIALAKKKQKIRIAKLKLLQHRRMLKKKELNKGKSGEFALEGQKRFTVKKWNAVALWGWDHICRTCAICRCDLMDQCIDCCANNTSQVSDECTIAWGICNHAFHFHCIARWLNTRNCCPLDNSEWHLQKVGK